MALADSLCAHKNPIVAYRARLLLAAESVRSPAMRKMRRAIGSSQMAGRLLTALHGERFNPYRKWQGPHWTLYSLAEIGFPAGDGRLIPLRQRVLDWMFAPAFLKPPSTLLFPDQPRRPRRCASMEGNTIWSQILPGIVDHECVSLLVERLIGFQWPDGGWNCDKRPAAHARGAAERAAEFLLEGKRLANGAFPVEWTNVRKTDRIETRGTYADWSFIGKKRGNPFVTVDALYVLDEAGRAP